MLEFLTGADKVCHAASTVRQALLRAPQLAVSRPGPPVDASVQTLSTQSVPTSASPENLEASCAAAALATFFAREGSEGLATVPNVPDEMLSNIVNLLLVLTVSGSAGEVAPLKDVFSRPLQAELARSGSQPERTRAWRSAAARLLHIWSA